ncbi:uncharacterized protein LOC135501837 [Lineus longissimus]|uniref:uncharacterized protein LOC135501837 n=1 Tax=Lineus longissimus TaxID=88925 RepID=UPI002B4E8899
MISTIMRVSPTLPMFKYNPSQLMRRIYSTRNVKCKIWQMTEAEIITIVRRMENTGWDIPLVSTLAKYHLSPHLALAAELDGETVGHLLGCEWSQNLVTLGNLFVREENRGLGIGELLRQANRDQVLTKVRAASIIPEQLKASAKVGLQFLSPTRIRSLMGNVCTDNLPTMKLPSDVEIFCYTDKILEAITEYDIRINTIASRGNFLKTCFDSPGVISRVAVRNTDSECDVVGYGALLPVKSGWRLEPLYADSWEIGLSILIELITSLPDKTPTVFLQVPHTNEMMSIFTNLGLKGRGVGDMYRVATEENFDLNIPMKKVFAVWGTEGTFI